MAIDTGVWSPHEFEVWIKPETTIGTALTTTMQRLNVTGISWYSQSVIQDIKEHPGDGRVHNKEHLYTSKDGIPITVQIAFIMDSDTATDTMLHENVLGTATSTAPSSVDLPYNYSGREMANGGAPTGNLDTFTVLFIVPEAANCVEMYGACCTELTVTMDAGTEGGRRHATATLTTFYPLVHGVTEPASPTDYGTLYRQLQDLTAKKSINSLDMIINKIEYTLSNPLALAGMTSAGIPEVLARGIGGVTATGVIGVKFDANTDAFNEVYEDGTTFPIEISDNATWASAAFGFKCDQAILTAHPTPAGGDSGVFHDLQIEFLGANTGTKDVIQIVP